MRTDLIALSLLCCAASAAQAAPPHQHGVAKLDVAVEARRITLQFESPLDNLLGFERAPRTAAERQQADAAVAKLKAADTLFRIDPAAGCKLTQVELVSAALGLGKRDPADTHEGHADVDADIEFSCADASKAGFIDTGLFGFTRLQQVAVQVVTPRGQFKRDLKRPAGRIVLAP